MMNKIVKQTMAFLMVLTIILSLIPAVAVQSSAASYTYNWGTRGVDATELSTTAKNWYSKYNIDIDDLLTDYSGNSSTSSVPTSTLYKKLQTLMKSAHTYINSYGDNKTFAKYTDCQNGGGAISSFYSGNAIGPSWDGTWNREHTWPNSKGLGGSDEDDVMMIRPTSTAENSSRGNTAYGDSNGFYNPNSASNGKYDLRGDCARIVLYVYVRWGNTSKMWGGSGVIQSKEVLLKWMEEDPVDTWELGRNDSVQSITGTRNMFVDYPELAFALFDAEIPDMVTPSGSADKPSYTITATSNNTAYGTVSVNKNVITAAPASGYYASGYTVTSGSATVTQSGNTFTVSTSANCSVQINFAAKAVATVTFSGASVSSQTGYAGEVMTLPDVDAPDGYSFVGWTSSALTEDVTVAPAYYTNSFTPVGNTVLYALYSYTEEGGNGGNGDYVKVTAAPADWSGEYLIVYEDGGYILNGSTISNSAGNYQTVTITNDTIKADAGDPYKFIIEPYSTGYSIKGAGGQYIYGTSGSNSINGSSTESVNTLSLNTDGSVNIISNTTYLRFNASANLFRYYKSSSYASQKAIALYVKNGATSTVCYTSKPEGLENAVSIVTQPKTVYGKNGEIVKTSVTAAGDGLTYQWFIKNAGASSYSKSSIKTATYSCIMDSTRKDRYVYCVITDQYGNSVQSQTVRLRMKVQITGQPTYKYCKQGATPVFKVTAIGSGLTYQWQYKKSSGSDWQNVAAASGKTANYSLTAQTRHSSYQYRCKVTDSAGNYVYTNTVYLYVLGIKTQPVTEIVKEGETAKFTVSATGSKKTYQWEYRKTSSSGWQNVAAASGKTASYSLTAQQRHNGYQYRCRITDSAGNVIYTSIVNLYVLGIKTQPVNKTVTEGNTAGFAVSATGKGLTYQWQYKVSSDDSWNNVAAASGKTANYSLIAKARHDGYQYRCKITDSAGNVIYTLVVKLTVQ